MTTLHPDMVWGVVDAVAYPSDRESILSVCRDGRVTLLRQAIAVTLVYECAMTYAAAGKVLARHHSTVLYGVRKEETDPRLQRLHRAFAERAAAHSVICTEACRMTHRIIPLNRPAPPAKTMNDLQGLPFAEAWAALSPATRDVVKAIADGLTLEEGRASEIWSKNKYLAATTEMYERVGLRRNVPLKIAAWYWKGRIEQMQKPRYGIKRAA